ncbi:MAG: hypothetical protein AAFZ80_05165 [Cyanobacteria bacterium P01_A01_bin.105]
MANQTATQANIKSANRYQQLAAAVKRTFLWGFAEEDGFTSSPNAQLWHSTAEDCYVYQPGDSCDVIDEGYDLLWLQKIRLTEISVSATRHGKVQVSYNGQPIIRMRGIGLIRTEDGCFSLDHWLAAA